MNAALNTEISHLPQGPFPIRIGNGAPPIPSLSFVAEEIKATECAVGGRLHRPIGLTPGTESIPLLVCVHGIARNTRKTIDCMAEEAARHGFAVFAPDFDAERFGDYQRLGRRGRGERADLALIAALDRISTLLNETGPSTAPCYLMGYSGGAQFAHRFVMAHPSRVAAVTSVAAGWYTLPRITNAFPCGLRVDGDLAGLRLEPEFFLQVPILVAVGDRDCERDANLRKTPRVDRAQGSNRVERARHFVSAMNRAAAIRGLPEPVRYHPLSGAGHSLSECVGAGLAQLTLDFFASIHVGEHS